MRANLFFIALCTYFARHNCGPNYVAYWERTEAIPGEKETLAEYSKFRVIRKGGDHLLNGTFVYKVDFDNTYKCELTTAYSAKGTSQYLKQPYQVEPRPVCDFFKVSYRRYGEPMFVNKSNFPLIPREGICPLPKGEYYITNAELVYDSFPWQLPKGLWKIELIYRNSKNEVVGGYRLFLRLTDKA